MEASPGQFQVTTDEQITAILGEAQDFVRAKVADHVDTSAAAFIAKSPLAFVGPVDRDGRLDVSPKGDAPGFVHVANPQTLLIPERKGNNLAFGPRNILATGRIGLIFVTPGDRETLRVNGTASLNNDPALLEQLSTNGKPALLCTEVTVEECFFHCGKAMIRSRVWDPAGWDAESESLLVAQVVEKLGGDPALGPVINATLEQSYIDDL